jgi:hypothetical protein
MANPRARLFPKVLNIPLTLEQHVRLGQARKTWHLNVAAFCRDAIERALGELEQRSESFAHRELEPRSTALGSR